MTTQCEKEIEELKAELATYKHAIAVAREVLGNGGTFECPPGDRRILGCRAGHRNDYLGCAECWKDHLLPEASNG